MTALIAVLAMLDIAYPWIESVALVLSALMLVVATALVVRRVRSANCEGAPR